MKKNMKPLVGISGSFYVHDDLPLYAMTTHYSAMVRTYLDAIPVMITPSHENDVIDNLLPYLSGVILTGGKTNIEPKLYGKNDENKKYDHTLRDPLKDHTDITLVNYCIEKSIPILGICRGLQAMNVALGGTLHENITDLPHKHSHVPYLQQCSDDLYKENHIITINENSLLSTFYSKKETYVNSIHFQGIDMLSPRLSINALSDDHIIEAISLKENRNAFFLGVQWHPEHPTTIMSDINQAIFKAFGQAISQYHG